MKTLEKLRLHNLEEICVDEQKSIKGGDDEITIDGGMLEEVVVTAQRIYQPSFNWSAGGYYGNSGGDYGFSNGGTFRDNYLTGSDQFSNQFTNLFRGWSCSDLNIVNTEEQGGGGGNVTFNNNCNISNDCLDFIKSWEKGPNGGPALTAYDDNGELPGGNMTIGWGHLIKQGEDFSSGITQNQSIEILMADLQNAIADVNNSVHVSLTQNQFDALVSYSFSTGPLAIKSPNCLAKLNSGDYAGAAAEMDIVTSGGIELPGLVTRRADEQTMFNDGVYNNHN